MSLALTHFFVGYAVGVLLMYARWREFSYLLATVSGVWAVVPDLYKLFPRGTTVGHAWERWLHETHLGDLFWFHHTMDQLDPTNSVTALFLACWVALVAVTFVDVRTPDVTTSGPVRE